MGSIIQLIQPIHGIWRWAVLIVALAAAVKFAIGWFGKGKVQPIDKQLASGYAIVMTIQFVLGLLNLIGFIGIGAFNPRIHMEHAVYGLIATGLAHAIPMRKDMRPDIARFRMGFVFVVASLIVVLVSVIRLRGGWSW